VVHVQPVLGVVNTLVLLASGLAMARAASLLRGGAGGTCRLWLLVAFLLGLSFLGIKSIEYNEKYKLGLLPAGQSSWLHDRADLYYLAHLKAVLSGALGTSRIGEPASNPEAEPPIGGPDGRAGGRAALMFGGVSWTEQQLGLTQNPARQQELLDRLAEAVYPLQASTQREDSARREQAEIRSRLAELQGQRTTREAVLSELQERVAQAQAKLAAAGAADQAAWSSALEQAKAEAATLTSQLTEGKSAESAAASRIEFLQLVAGSPAQAGLDRVLGLNLPKVIPQGRTWASTYFLLTGCHALHLIAGLVVLGGLLLTRLGPNRLAWVENTSLYWQFVDIVWLVLFPLIYLI
jgi:heme/copper-type cytochrome/quinol oxidase subunit 3